MMKTLTVGALLLAVPSSATTLVALDLPALTRGSDAIVHGRVARVEAKLSKDGARISTTATVEVQETLKGEPSGVIEVVQPGGVVGDIGQKVAGTAHLKVGDEVVAFLERRGATRFILTGMAQGCFRVERSSDGASAFAVQDQEGDVLMLDPATRQPVQKHLGPMKLDELKRQVRIVGAPAAPQDPATPARPVLPGTVK